ncbi:MAG: glycerol-3-phosphate dehydrogenase/oxidase [Bacteroidota bacterium]
MNILSALNRAKAIEQLSNTTYDLLVIGGGITGAGIALDAASRGLKVALIEKRDFASGTSSKSTKLIHGGLRYLKQLEVQLVREVGKERATVHRLAPHLVKSEKMLLPLVKGGTYGGFATSIGLWVYDLLAGVTGDDKRRMLDKKKTQQKEPLLRDDILTGSGYYAEYRTDDARLTIENIKTAADYGAVSLNYIKAVDFNYEKGKIRSVQCEDILEGTTFTIDTQYVISAAGPWVDNLRKKDGSLSGKRLFLSKGVHIVVPHDRLPVKQSVYFDVSDGRMLFAIPRQRVTYIGTTDTPYKGDINNIPVYLEDVDYLLEGVNAMFPEAKLTREDVESSWAGLRPLIHEEGKSASEMSRKDEIFEAESGLLSIAGGKLTGYRKMAERIVDRVVKRYESQSDVDLKDCFTQKIPLSGGPFAGAKEVEAYTKTVADRLSTFELEQRLANYLVHNYGKQTDAILDVLSRNSWSGPIGLIKAELLFGIEHELVIQPMDFLNRRSGRLYFDLPSILPALDEVLSVFKQYFGWSEQEVRAEKNKIEHILHEHAHFVSESLAQTAS